MFYTILLLSLSIFLSFNSLFLSISLTRQVLPLLFSLFSFCYFQYLLSILYPFLNILFPFYRTPLLFPFLPTSFPPYSLSFLFHSHPITLLPSLSFLSPSILYPFLLHFPLFFSLPLLHLLTLFFPHDHIDSPLCLSLSLSIPTSTRFISLQYDLKALILSHEAI